MSLNQAPISAQRDRSSSLNLLRDNTCRDFPAKADEYWVSSLENRGEPAACRVCDLEDREEADECWVYDFRSFGDYAPDGFPREPPKQVSVAQLGVRAPSRSPSKRSADWYERRDKRDQVARDRLVASYEKIGLPRRAEVVGDCQKIRDVRTCFVHERWKSFPRGCSDRLCPHHQRLVAARFIPVFEELIQRMAWPVFGTLTIPNIAHLEGAHYDLLRRSFRRLRQRSFWKNNCRGGFYCLQVTYSRNRDASWNLHLHFVADARYVDSTDLSREWLSVLPPDWQEGVRLASARAATKFYSIIKLRRVGPRHTEGEYSPGKAAKEMAKYVAGGSGNLLGDSNAVAEFVGATKGKRLFETFGGCNGEVRKIEQALREEPSSFDCPECLAAGLPSGRANPSPDAREDAGMAWVGKFLAVGMERDADGSLVPKKSVRDALKLKSLRDGPPLGDGRVEAPRAYLDDAGGTLFCRGPTAERGLPGCP